MPRPLPIFIALLPFAAGCIRHEAAVQPTPPPAEARTGGAVVGPAITPWPQAAQQRTGTRPQTLHADGWLSTDDGLLIARARARSPLSWWQRFPADIAADLWPGTLIAASTADFAPAPLTPIDPAALRAEAAAAGYVAPPETAP